MRILKAALVVAVACLGLVAQANPDILKQFKKVYEGKHADCIVCHLAPPKEPRNPFGKQVEEALKGTSDFVLTKAVMETIEAKDADGDGVSNIDEINAGTLPGDPKSKPDPKASAPAPVADPPLIPKHSFHPAIVHFPVALLAIAAFLELLNRRKSNPQLHSASVINLALGLITSLGAIATGIVAFLRLGYKIEGDLLIHLLLATASVLVGFGAYSHREKPSYLPLILISGLLVLAAGHFGGNMVYG